jgi:hypothetical protein
MTDEGRLPVEQRIKTTFSAETRSVVVTQRRLHARFQTINCTQFNNDGSVLERKLHRPSSIRSSKNIDAVRVALQSPSKSIRKAESQLGISRPSVQRILKSD